MESTLERLQKLNEGLKIKELSDPSFARFGRIVKGLDGKKAFEYARTHAIVPEVVVYEPSVAGLEADEALLADASRLVYGGMPIQIGWCYGRNSFLNALEYHKGDEVLVAVTDTVLLLGWIGDVAWEPEPAYDTSKIEAFYVPAGAFVEIYGSTLHYAPIHSNAQGGFVTMIILPKGTNTPVDFPVANKGEARLLFGRNKWLIVHPEDTFSVKMGAYAGLVGKNIEVKGL